MATGNNQKTANGSALEFEAHLWAAAEQAVPAPDCKKTGCHNARPEGLFGFSDPKSGRFIKKVPQRAGTAENQDEYKAFIIRGIDANVGPRADNFRQNLHPDLKVDSIPLI